MRITFRTAADFTTFQPKIVFLFEGRSIAEFSLEAAQDLKALHGIDAVEVLRTAILSQIKIAIPDLTQEETAFIESCIKPDI